MNFPGGRCLDYCLPVLKDGWGSAMEHRRGERIFHSQNVQLSREKEYKSGDGESEAKVEHGKEQKHSPDPLVFTPTEAPEVEAEDAEG